MCIDTSDIYQDLQDKLVTARFSPGAKLKPSKLQGAYGCSANTVRDVLLRLSKVGLVEFEMQRGFRARGTSPEQRHDVTRFRTFLEQEGATLSMARGGVAWEAELSAAHHALSHIESQIAQSGDVEPLLSHWSDAEWRFHEVLISACGSPLLRETYESIYLQFRQQIVSQERDFGSSYFRVIIDEHQAILDAALSRNAETCRKAIFDHLKRNLQLEQ